MTKAELQELLPDNVCLDKAYSDIWVLKYIPDSRMTFDIDINSNRTCYDVLVHYYNQDEGSIHEINAVRLRKDDNDSTFTAFIKCLPEYIKEAHRNYMQYVNNMSVFLDSEGMGGNYQYIRA